MISDSGPTDPAREAHDSIQRDLLGALAESFGRDPVSLLAAAQRAAGFLSDEVLDELSRQTGLSLARLRGLATFYNSFSLVPRGRRVIRVCQGTACHVRGSERIWDSLSEHLELGEGRSVTSDGELSIETAACLGCCSLAPVLQVGDETFGRLVARDVGAFLEGLSARPAASGELRSMSSRRPNRVAVGLGSCGVAAGGRQVFMAARAALRDLGIEADLVVTGCLGLCYREVLVELQAPELGRCLYGEVSPERVAELLVDWFLEKRVPAEGLVAREGFGSTPLDGLVPSEHDEGFVHGQTRIVLRNCGRVDPESLDDYVARDGYASFRRAIATMRPESVIEQIVASGLRGRGGAGFPTGLKWSRARASRGDQKFVIANGDEGDPGAFMDRSVLEGDPFSVLEGLSIAGFAVGAHEGIVYIRDEYALAVERMQLAVEAARARGLLGTRIEGSAFSFDVRIARGAGAFVCGEETALIASLEGGRGTPRLRPPYPVERGYLGRPTCINNVETLANVPWILEHGPAAYRAYGIGESRGTKVFSLAGDIRRSGLIEVPMGITIREIVEDLGGGSPRGLPIKAVQVGGPSGGCIPASLFDTPVDYESLVGTGAIMGSGGLVAMDESACMVDIARYFLAFTQAESCGKCTFCRIGTKRMLEILDELVLGRARPGDLERLETLAWRVRASSLCGLGKSAPNPVLTTLRYFKSEYEAHLKGECPAKKCRALIRFQIDRFVCDSCARCHAQCPAHAISVPVDELPLAIDPEQCIRCAGCFEACQFGAILRLDERGPRAK
ncbi:MAG: NAD(P)H-dependent oxidoreductase subunit E [Deltaproteobacteria bacterium]|nr:NAD(P)H-dependent oxidoreductase subunit E [Deltaproteobacteria bacterium]